ncbi:MAG TPA: plasmid replication/partition related protein [Aquabacterium sp.]|uniref:plasmid replication/partition related protein n=1 Tax=Aquabacterium sp. TaxID=1872578 RepID=UPI002E323E49|nr:plasmid replication/partition related protein [Aquabacterium sp.]HEX5356343.1 plasmid replication/partition related protein [Aquabacterium sp.]
MNITVLEELRAYIDPLTPEEHEALERSILAEGCRDALVLWGEVLVDGHNRYGICQKHGIPFQTIQHPAFKSMEDVHLWMIDQHLGRRSVSDFQRGVLALRKKDILSARAQQAQAQAQPADAAASTAPPVADEAALPDQGAAAKTTEPLTSREALAKAARISATTISQIEKIQKTAAPELVAAVKAGDISINAAAIVATLPVEEQVAAAAGGKKELRQAAKQIREAKAQARAAAVGAMLESGEAGLDGEEPAPSRPFLANQQPDETDQQFIARLQRILQDLQAENLRLKARVAELSA